MIGCFLQIGNKSIPCSKLACFDRSWFPCFCTPSVMVWVINRSHWERWLVLIQFWLTKYNHLLMGTLNWSVFPDALKPGTFNTTLVEVLGCWDVWVFFANFSTFSFSWGVVQVHLNCTATDFCASMRLNAGTCEMRQVGWNWCRVQRFREVSAKSESPILFRQEFVDKDSLKSRHAFAVVEL